MVRLRRIFVKHLRCGWTRCAHGVHGFPGLKGETGSTRRGGSSGLQATESSESIGAFRLGPFSRAARQNPFELPGTCGVSGRIPGKGPWLKPRSLRAGIQEPEGSCSLRHLRCGWTRFAHGVRAEVFSPALRDGGTEVGADPGFPLRSAQGSPWAILSFPLRGKGKNRWEGWGLYFPWVQKRDLGHPPAHRKKRDERGTAPHGSWRFLGG
jgi:hypothetical protein